MPVTITLFSRFSLRDLTKNWLRTLLTASGIALGISVVLAISLANDSVLAKFKESVDLVSGKANLELVPKGSEFLDESCLERIRWLWLAGAKFTPLIEENVSLVGDGGDFVQLLGIDPLAYRNFLAHEEPVDEQSSQEAGRTLMTEEAVSNFEQGGSVIETGTVVIGSGLAQEHNLRRGQTLTILANEKTHRLKIANVLPSNGLGTAFGGKTVVADLVTAQQILGISGKISRVLVIAPAETSQEIKAKLTDELPPNVQTQRPSRRGQQVEKMTASFQQNLLALTFIALLVGMFLIYNSMTISVIRRRSEIGILRAIGVSRRTILAIFASEALVLGVLGSLIGVALGVVFSRYALVAVSSTFEHFYVKQPVDHIAYEPRILLLNFCLGVLATLSASLAPVLEASRIAPAEALRNGSYEIKITRNVGVLALIGLVALALGFVAACSPPIFNFPLFGHVAALLWIIGCSLVMPISLQQFLGCASRVFTKFGLIEFRLAARCLDGALGRSSVASASLMIGIAMMISLSIMITSFRQTVTTWLEQTLKADLWVQTLGRAKGNEHSRMSPATLEIIRTTDGVMAVDGFVQYLTEYEGEPCNLAAADLDVVAKFGKLAFKSGEPSAQVLSRVSNDTCIVSEAFALRHRLNRGDNILLETKRGPLGLRIEGVYYDYASDLGFIVMQRSQYAKSFDDTSASSCAVYIDKDKKASSVRSMLFKRLGQGSNLSIQTTGDLRAEAMRIFDRTFAVTNALHGIAVLVAILAITNALVALAFQFRRHFAILRHLGASQGQLRKIILLEAGLLGITGNIGGVVLGFLLSLLLIYVINRQSFGWTIQFTMPTFFLFESTLLVLGTAILAGFWPAHLAANSKATLAIREE